ncbi:peptidoglycan-binding protein [Hyphococcus flavus]|uniref:Peptidoglycan-binding protein n=1 Tax=Hyphococcus flavus TaxID=1866326 RepID=A0AAE9ZGX2_9PROT|nr:peptidoglycan-binding protein [Hyphococcus flavus]WDI32823.1 peptidoglycan-binding protein [Hyphococcus flavus]
MLIGKARRMIGGLVAASFLAMATAPAHATYEAGIQAYKNGQYSQALDLWRRFAVAGDIRSKKILGDVYSGKMLEVSEGAATPLEEIPVDNVQALLWYTLAAYHDFSAYQLPTAAEVNAQILAEARLTDIRFRMSSSDVNKAEDLISRTFEAGSAYDIYRLGEMYQKGAGLEKSNTKALQMYSLAKERGVGEASAAYEFLEPLMNPKEIKLALENAEEWQPPLPPEHTGKTRQQEELERLKRELEEIRMADALEAVSDIDVELIQRSLNALGFRAGAVDNSLGPATRGAIRRFQYSTVARDFDMSEEEKQSVVTGVLTPRQTVDLFQDAAQAEHPMSQYVYGIMHVRGIGVEQDGEQAVRWLTAAADHDLSIAHYALGVVYRDGTTGLNEIAPDERKSAYHLARASALGYTPANDALRRLSFEYTRDIQ